MSLDIRDQWVARVVGGKSYVEVGGLWGEVNEMVTLAHVAGATDLCMVDIWQPESEWWPKFRKRCAAKEVGPVREVVGSIDNPFIEERVGKYDVVYCGGMLYHCPNPLLTVRNLMSLSRGVILLATMVMPAVIENEFGRLEFGGESAICLPFIGEKTRKIIDKYSADHIGGVIAEPAKSPWYFNDGAPNYGPWWWLWSAEYVKNMLITCGLEVTDSTPLWGGGTQLYVCQISAGAVDPNCFAF